MPDQSSGEDIERRPGAPGDLLSARNQCVGLLVAVGDCGVDAPSIAGGAPLDSACTAAGPDLRMPPDVAVVRLQSPVDAALLSESDHVVEEIQTRAAEDENKTSRRKTGSFKPGTMQGTVQTS